MGYFPKHRIALIQISYYEGAEWRLVRLDGGKEAEGGLAAALFAAAKWLVAACSGDGPSGSDNRSRSCRHAGSEPAASGITVRPTRARSCSKSTAEMVTRAEADRDISRRQRTEDVSRIGRSHRRQMRLKMPREDRRPAPAAWIGPGNDVRFRQDISPFVLPLCHKDEWQIQQALKSSPIDVNPASGAPASRRAGGQAPEKTCAASSRRTIA